MLQLFTLVHCKHLVIYFGIDKVLFLGDLSIRNRAIFFILLRSFFFSLSIICCVFEVLLSFIKFNYGYALSIIGCMWLAVNGKLYRFV